MDPLEIRVIRDCVISMKLEISVDRQLWRMESIGNDGHEEME